MDFHELTEQQQLDVVIDLREKLTLAEQQRDELDRKCDHWRDHYKDLLKRIADSPVVAHAVMNGDRVLQLSVSCDPMFPRSSQLIIKKDLK